MGHLQSWTTIEHMLGCWCLCLLPEHLGLSRIITYLLSLLDDPCKMMHFLTFGSRTGHSYIRIHCLESCATIISQLWLNRTIIRCMNQALPVLIHLSHASRLLFHCRSLPRPYVVWRALAVDCLNDRKCLDRMCIIDIRRLGNICSVYAKVGRSRQIAYKPVLISVWAVFITLSPPLSSRL